MILTQNKQAMYDYETLERFEAGLVLSGAEVKSVKAGQVNLKGAYVTFKGTSTPLLIGAHIARYKPATTYQHDYKPDRSRILLLNKKEIRYLFGKTKEKTLTLVPTKVYLRNNLVKIEIAVAKGKKKYDKREVVKKRDFERQKLSYKNS